MFLPFFTSVRSEFLAHGRDAAVYAIASQHLHDGVHIGGIELAGDGQPQEHTDIGHIAGVSAGIFFIGLHIIGKADVGGHLFDLAEPRVGIIGDIKSRGKGKERLFNGFLSERGRIFVFYLKPVVIEEIQIILYFGKNGEILSGFLPPRPMARIALA